MITKTILGLLMVFSTTISISQNYIKYSAKIGLNISSLSGDYPSQISHTSKAGLHIGGVAEYKLKDKISLQGEFLISTQGGISEYRMNYYNPDMGNYYESQQQTLKLTYLNIPLLFRYQILNRVTIDAGPQLGFVLSGKNVLEYKDSTDPTNNETVELNALEDGTFTSGGVTYTYKASVKRLDLSFNLGVTYDIDDKFYIQSRYNKGITTMDKNSTIGTNTSSWNLKNSVFQFSVGYKF
jgi:hypothetical protein